MKPIRLPSDNLLVGGIYGNGLNPLSGSIAMIRSGLHPLLSTFNHHRTTVLLTLREDLHETA